MSSRRRAVTTALLGILAAPTALAQDDERDYFPLVEGTRWEYTLDVTQGGQSSRIQYTAEVVRSEEVDGLDCMVVEHRSGARLLLTSWYHASDAGVVRHVKRRNTRKTVAFRDGAGEPGRILVDPAAADGTTWEWTAADGSAEGTITLRERQTIRTRSLGELDCIYVVESAEWRAGGQTATEERELWLAPGIGLVKESSTIRIGEAVRTTAAELERRPELG